jgi:hypothetical protein
LREKNRARSPRPFCKLPGWFWHRPNVLCRNTMLRHAAVFAGSALRGGSRIASEARQLQQIRYLNVHEYQVRPSRPSSLQIASLLNVPH